MASIFIGVNIMLPVAHISKKTKITSLSPAKLSQCYIISFVYLLARSVALWGEFVFWLKKS